MLAGEGVVRSQFSIRVAKARRVESSSVPELSVVVKTEERPKLSVSLDRLSSVGKRSA